MRKLSNLLSGLLLLVLFSCASTKTTSKASLTVTETKTATVDSFALKHIEQTKLVTISDNTVKTTNELITTFYKVDSITKKAEPVKQTIERHTTEAVNTNKTDNTSTNQSDSICKRTNDKSTLDVAQKETKTSKPYNPWSVKIISALCVIILITGYFIFKRFF